MKVNTKDKRYIRRILLFIFDIHSYLKDKKLEELHYNTMLFDAVCMKLFQIGEFSIRISKVFKENTKEIPWIKIKGFRNILAHEYVEVKTHIVINILKSDLKILENVLNKIDLN